jgi:hypothetical protein
MIDMSDKEQSRERRAAIRRILMSEWDPIGVNDTPEAADEYDGYIGPVLEAFPAELSNAAGQKSVADFPIARLGQETGGF